MEIVEKKTYIQIRKLIFMLKKLLKYLSLRTELDDYETIDQSIKTGIIFKGTNLWILVFAIFIASIGLNMNSTAVIIGAMLISPLMGPINGMGYSIAIYDFALFRLALKNFAFAVGASLLASTLYFTITPLSTAHSELLARTTPTIYDVLIALVGGLAGMVATSSRHKGNVIIGVAIATALMPPLCTAGYGLATGQLRYFFGAFYLFTINTVFIGISATVTSRLLKFPFRSIVDVRQKTRVNRWVLAVIFITTIPSVYLGYELVQNERFQEKAERLAGSVNVVEGSYLLKSNIKPVMKTVELIYGGAALTPQHKKIIVEKAEELSISQDQLVINQGFSFNQVTSSTENSLKAEINRLNLILKEKDAQRDSILNRPLLGQSLLQEVSALFPVVTSCSVAETTEFNVKGEERGVTLVTLTVSGKGLGKADRVRLERWLKTKLNSSDLRIYLNP
jgi:uncharacterized hydrophobic protein (TIGR00271 family)